MFLYETVVCIFSFWVHLVTGFMLAHFCSFGVLSQCLLLFNSCKAYSEQHINWKSPFKSGVTFIMGMTSAQRVHAVSPQLCPTLCSPMDHSLPGSSVHGILQARILEWVAIYPSSGSSPSKDQIHVS